MRILRNIFRRKMRAFLTIFGITIGVFALVVMGAMAEKLNLLVEGGVVYYKDKVVVSAEGAVGGFGVNPLSVNKMRDLEDVAGVRAVSAQIGMLLEDLGAVNMGQPASISATDLKDRPYETSKLTYAEGRPIKPGERGVVVVGSDLVDKLEAHLGGTVELKDERFTVVGILGKTLTAPDNAVEIPLADAQELYKQELPDALQSGVNERTIVTQFVVFPENGVDPDQLARRIERNVDGVVATGPQDFQTQVVDQLAVFTSIIFGIALISLLVGGLSVINTMTMSVSERTREIGIRKAIGASSGAIMRQFIAESAVIGLIGGVLGLGLGSLVASGLNAAGAAGGNALFLVTTRLAVGSVIFALGLGVVSGLYPAWHAASLNPVQALRYE